MLYDEAIALTVERIEPMVFCGIKSLAMRISDQLVALSMAMGQSVYGTGQSDNAAGTITDFR